MRREERLTDSFWDKRDFEAAMSSFQCPNITHSHTSYCRLGNAEPAGDCTANERVELEKDGQFHRSGEDLQERRSEGGVQSVEGIASGRSEEEHEKWVKNR